MCQIACNVWYEHYLNFILTERLWQSLRKTKIYNMAKKKQLDKLITAYNFLSCRSNYFLAKTWTKCYPN